jgi:hypothetical protein
MVLEDHIEEISVTAVYSHPKHNIKTTDYEHFLQTLGHRFTAGGDYNAKNTYWGSRTTTTKGKELNKAMRKNNFQNISSNQPTFWSSDMTKQPDLYYCLSKLVSGPHIGPHTNYSDYVHPPQTTENTISPYPKHRLGHI